MRRRDRSRLAGVLAVCLAGHAIVIFLLDRGQPIRSRAPLGPAVFEVTVVPMFVATPTPSPSRRPRPLLHVRQAREPGPDAPPPLLAPELLPAPPPPPGPPPHLTPEMGAILRRALGCSNITGMNLTQAERDACMARLGQGARDAPYLGAGLSREKQEALDGAGAAKEAYRRYKEAPIPPGLSSSSAAGGLTGLGEAPPSPKHPF